MKVGRVAEEVIVDGMVVVGVVELETTMEVVSSEYHSLETMKSREAA